MYSCGEEIILINQPVILVVEDDRAVQIVIGDTLDEGGFEPAITASGEEAVTLLKGQKGRYRALVADIGLRGRMSAGKSPHTPDTSIQNSPFCILPVLTATNGPFAVSRIA